MIRSLFYIFESNSILLLALYTCLCVKVLVYETTIQF